MEPVPTIQVLASLAWKPKVRSIAPTKVWYNIRYSPLTSTARIELFVDGQCHSYVLTEGKRILCLQARVSMVASLLYQVWPQGPGHGYTFLYV